MRRAFALCCDETLQVHFRVYHLLSIRSYPPFSQLCYEYIVSMYSLYITIEFRLYHHLQELLPLVKDAQHFGLRDLCKLISLTAHHLALLYLLINLPAVISVCV